MVMSPGKEGPSSGKWSGTNDGDPWTLQIEPDCMAFTEPFTVSVWVGEQFVCDTTVKDNIGGAFLSPTEARQAAAVLLVAADAADASNERARAYEKSTSAMVERDE